MALRTIVLLAAVAVLSVPAFAQDPPRLAEASDIDTVTDPGPDRDTTPSATDRAEHGDRVAEAPATNRGDCTLDAHLCDVLESDGRTPRASLGPTTGGEVEAEAETGFLGDPLPDRGYRRFIVDSIDMISEMDLYGVSAQLPQGWLKIKWDYGWLEANRRFDSDGNLGPPFNPISFELGGEEQLNVDLDLAGSGNGHTFQVSYGILDPLDYYIEVPFTAMNLNLNPVVNAIDEEGNTIGEAAAGLLGVADRMAYNASNFLYETFPELGRPAPATAYDGKWLLGDINTGFSWNIFRNERFSTAWTNRVFLPTGHIPDPESNLTYATGPQPEIGVGGWGVSTTSGYDLRVFKHGFWVDIILSTEIGFGYFFRQERDYPTNFVEPNPAAVQIDPASFPDLSNLEGSFHYTPGFNMDWSSQLNMAIAGVNFGVAYGWSHSQEPLLDAEPEFVQMVEGLELLGAQSLSEVQLGVSVSLLPLYIPANVGIVRRLMVDGRDALAFDNFWQLTVETFAPLHLLWNRNRGRDD